MFYCPFLSTIFHVQLGEVPKVSGERYSKEVEDSRLTAVQASSDEAKLKPFQQFTLNADNLQCFLAGEKKDIIKPQVATSIFCSVVKIGSLKLFGHKNGMARKEQGFPEEKKNTKPYFVWRGCWGGGREVTLNTEMVMLPSRWPVCIFRHHLPTGVCFSFP